MGVGKIQRQNGRLKFDERMTKIVSLGKEGILKTYQKILVGISRE